MPDTVDCKNYPFYCLQYRTQYDSFNLNKALRIYHLVVVIWKKSKMCVNSDCKNIFIKRNVQKVEFASPVGRNVLLMSYVLMAMDSILIEILQKFHDLHHLLMFLIIRRECWLLTSAKACSRDFVRWTRFTGSVCKIWVLFCPSSSVWSFIRIDGMAWCLNVLLANWNTNVLESYLLVRKVNVLTWFVMNTWYDLCVTLMH